MLTRQRNGRRDTYDPSPQTVIYCHYRQLNRAERDASQDERPTKAQPFQRRSKEGRAKWHLYTVGRLRSEGEGPIQIRAGLIEAGGLRGRPSSTTSVLARLEPSEGRSASDRISRAATVILHACHHPPPPRQPRPLGPTEGLSTHRFNRRFQRHLVELRGAPTPSAKHCQGISRLCSGHQKKGSAVGNQRGERVRGEIKTTPSLDRLCYFWTTDLESKEGGGERLI